VQTTGAPLVHTPDTHESDCVHRSASAHGVPSGAIGSEHVPVAGAQVPAWWHASLAAQTTGLPPAQTPDWQASTWVQASPSLHTVPSGAAGSEHVPVAGAHVPAWWQASLAVQITGLPLAHAPDWHVSDWVQRLPSLHADPFGLAGLEHVPVAGAHVPASWH
jgi:hypothetical protein